jgi:hypothetical protein
LEGDHKFLFPAFVHRLREELENLSFWTSAKKVWNLNHFPVVLLEMITEKSPLPMDAGN